MNRSTRQLSLTLVILATALAGCDVSFEESITPLVVNTLPPPAVFVTPGAAQTQAPLETEEAQPMTIEPVEGTPELQPMCTTDYLRLRDQPAEGGQELVTMPPGAQVQWTGEQAEGDGYTWYEVAFTDDIQGWAANQWLAAGDCGDVVVGGGNFGLIESGYITGFDWLDADSGTEHFGIDLHSATGNSAITSPYDDEVVDTDVCTACTEADAEEGNTLGEFDLDYNYGYGAMTVVEYAYEDLSEEQRNNLTAEGIELGEGESLYLMMGHLDPTQTISDDGTALTQGGGLATIGNSGNSDGAHTHLEMAINESGLTPSEDQATVNFWLDTVAERVYGAEEEADRQGNRLDPTPLFDE
jgi:hypothetical protein